MRSPVVPVRVRLPSKLTKKKRLVVAVVDLRQGNRAAQRAAELVVGEPRHRAGLEEAACGQRAHAVELK
jgi:hypothetical protein